VKDYVVQSGPLRTFDSLYDNRYDKLRPVGDFHTICIIGKPVTERIAIQSMSRSASQEITFLTALFTELAGGNNVIFGLRDITGGKAGELAKKLFRLDGVPWHKALYGATEDDLVVMEIKNFAAGVGMLRDFVPPDEGSFFCYLTAIPFDAFQIYWDRSVQASLKSRDDRFRRDVMALAIEAKITLWQDPDGSYTLMLNPKVKDVEAVERAITAAGEKAGMTITFAPGLFG
jgi:hypothetical protein